MDKKSQFILLVFWKLTGGGLYFENFGVFFIVMLLVSYVFMGDLLKLYSSFEEYISLIQSFWYSKILFAYDFDIVTLLLQLVYICLVIGFKFINVYYWNYV